MIRSLYFFIAVFLLPAGMLGNISAPPRPRPGQLSFEPILNKHFTVRSEELTVDMRPAEQSGNSLVAATYHLYCDTSVEKAELVFVANNLADGKFKILLDGETVPGDTISLDSVPSSWLAPDDLYWDDQKISVRSPGWSYDFQNSYILFSVRIPEGQHTLQVEYEAMTPQMYISMTVTSSFIYILSPAKDWKSYQHLDLKIALPKDWIWRSNLPLKKEGEWLHGQWNSLPTDCLYIATRYPDENADLYLNLYLCIGSGLIIVIILWRLFVLMKKDVNEQISSNKAWTQVLWYVLIGDFLFFVLFFNRAAFLKIFYGSQLRGDITHGDFYNIFGFPMLWGVGIGVGYAFQAIVYLILHFRKKNSTSNP